MIYRSIIRLFEGEDPRLSDPTVSKVEMLLSANIYSKWRELRDRCNKFEVELDRKLPKLPIQTKFGIFLGGIFTTVPIWVLTAEGTTGQMKIFASIAPVFVGIYGEYMASKVTNGIDYIRKIFEEDNNDGDELEPSFKN